VPVRDFSAGGVVRTAVGACGVTPPLTYVSLVRLGLASSAEWLIAFQNASHEGAVNWNSFGVEGSELLTYPGGQTGYNPPRPNIWCLLAVTKATGSNKAVFYIYRYDTKEWIKKESTGVFTWGFSGTPAEIQFGLWNGTEQFKGRYAAAAIFGKQLTEAEVKELAEGSSIQSWLTKSPKGLWMFNQPVVTESVPDSTGNGANQSGRVGTTVFAEEPPIPYLPPAEAPVAETLPATNVKDKSASLKGNVDPNGAATTYYFEYGTTEAYGSAIPVGKNGAAGSGLSPVAVSQALSGLEPETTYHFRLVAENEKGKSTGADQTFTTKALITGVSVKVLAGGEVVSAKRWIMINGELVSF
jgi:hypothetical protein